MRMMMMMIIIMMMMMMMIMMMMMSDYSSCSECGYQSLCGSYCSCSSAGTIRRAKGATDRQANMLQNNLELKQLN